MFGTIRRSHTRGSYPVADSARIYGRDVVCDLNILVRSRHDHNQILISGMPEKLEDPGRPPDQSERITSSQGLIPYNHLPRQPAMLASSTQGHPMGPASLSSLSQQRPSLPPLSQLCGHDQSATSSPYSDIFPSHAASAYPPHRGMPSFAAASPQGRWSRNVLPMRSSGMRYQSVSPTTDPAYSHDPRGQQYSPLKRSHEIAEASAERQVLDPMMHRNLEG